MSNPAPSLRGRAGGEAMISFDHQLLLLINGLHTSFLDSLMWLISEKLVWIPFYFATLFMVWRNRQWRGILHLLILVGIMMLFTDTLNYNLIRPFFHRLRPANLDSPVGPLVHIVNDYRGGQYGFPSAHAANYWGLSLLIYYFARSKRLLASLSILTLIVCYSRSYLGVHYPADLLAGIIYATLVVGIICYIHNKYFKLSPVENVKLSWLPGLTALLTIIVFIIISFFKV